MNPVMYIFVNSAIGMSPGKLAAQASHAAVLATLRSQGITADNLYEQWMRGGHYARVILDGGSSDKIQVIERYLNDRGFLTNLIIDEGRTEIDEFTPTALGVALVDKDDEHTKRTFSSFKLLKERQPEVVDLPEDIFPDLKEPCFPAAPPNFKEPYLPNLGKFVWVSKQSAVGTDEFADSLPQDGERVEPLCGGCRHPTSTHTMAHDACHLSGCACQGFWRRRTQRTQPPYRVTYTNCW